MTYVTGNVTVGRYDPTRLANLGLGHNAIDVGGGYTYFNPQTGNEFSAVLGLSPRPLAGSVSGSNRSTWSRPRLLSLAASLLSRSLEDSCRSSKLFQLRVRPYMPSDL
jgi:hypothetical protein